MHRFAGKSAANYGLSVFLPIPWEICHQRWGIFLWSPFPLRRAFCWGWPHRSVFAPQPWQKNRERQLKLRGIQSLWAGNKHEFLVDQLEDVLAQLFIRSWEVDSGFHGFSCSCDEFYSFIPPDDVRRSSDVISFQVSRSLDGDILCLSEGYPERWENVQCIARCTYH